MGLRTPYLALIRKPDTQWTTKSSKKRGRKQKEEKTLTPIDRMKNSEKKELYDLVKTSALYRLIFENYNINSSERNELKELGALNSDNELSKEFIEKFKTEWKKLEEWDKEYKERVINLKTRKILSPKTNVRTPIEKEKSIEQIEKTKQRINNAISLQEIIELQKEIEKLHKNLENDDYIRVLFKSDEEIENMDLPDLKRYVKLIELAIEFKNFYKILSETNKSVKLKSTDSIKNMSLTNLEKKLEEIKSKKKAYFDKEKRKHYKEQQEAIPKPKAIGSFEEKLKKIEGQIEKAKSTGKKPKKLEENINNNTFLSQTIAKVTKEKLAMIENGDYAKFLNNKNSVVKLAAEKKQKQTKADEALLTINQYLKAEKDARKKKISVNKYLEEQLKTQAEKYGKSLNEYKNILKQAKKKGLKAKNIIANEKYFEEFNKKREEQSKKILEKLAENAMLTVPQYLKAEKAAYEKHMSTNEYLQQQLKVKAEKHGTSVNEYKNILAQAKEKGITVKKLEKQAENALLTLPQYLKAIKAADKKKMNINKYLEEQLKTKAKTYGKNVNEYKNILRQAKEKGVQVKNIISNKNLSNQQTQSAGSHQLRAIQEKFNLFHANVSKYLKNKNGKAPTASQVNREIAKRVKNL
jgi:plasmid stability protein